MKHVENALNWMPSDLPKSVFEWNNWKKSVKPEVRTSIKTKLKNIVKKQKNNQIPWKFGPGTQQNNA